MTGLNPTTDTILSLSCYITDAHLNLLDPTGYHATITTPKTALDAMDSWCTRTHTESGLVAACQSDSAVPAAQAAAELLQYIKSYVPTQKKALLAGNSVHADKMFLMREPWAEVLGWLHYRIFDVSSIKEGVRRWCSNDVIRKVPAKKLAHTAEEDVKESIEEARYYMGLFERLERGDGD
ncbi:Phosphatidylinositol 3,4,5-trisphosphate-dependent Rac exchanger 2 protein [Knufia obscura]|nr:Phosphatidylinositol 3,4,5-trisphosphate-dependent Rac exchanger 2 protein [Knufia obscura]